MINSNRIAKICDCVSCSCIAEIGADHGYITKELFDRGKIKFAVLTDISDKCLNKAKSNFKKSIYIEKTSFLVGDGIRPLLQHFGMIFTKSDAKLLTCDKALVNTMQNGFSDFEIIIAGMGGREIIKILGVENPYLNFVLQPQKNVVELRNFLQDNCYKIITDTVVKDGKMFYNVLVVKKTNLKCKLSRDEIIFGKTNLIEKTDDFKDFVDYEIEKTKGILQKKNIDEKKAYLAKLQKIKKDF